MRIDLINQTMQIDTGNVGVNAWMFRVISGVRIWHVGDAGNWKTLCLIFREKCGEKNFKFNKLKQVNNWREGVQVPMCSQCVLIILEPNQIIKEGDVFLLHLVNFLTFFVLRLQIVVSVCLKSFLKVPAFAFNVTIIVDF